MRNERKQKLVLRRFCDITSVNYAQCLAIFQAMPKEERFIKVNEVSQFVENYSRENPRFRTRRKDIRKEGQAKRQLERAEEKALSTSVRTAGKGDSAIRINAE